MEKLIALLMPMSPVLAAALGGRGADLALAALGRAIVQDDEAGADAIAAALSANDPDAPLKVRKAEADFQKQRADVEIELARIAAERAATSQQTLVTLEATAAAERASARQRQATTNDRTNAYLAYIVTLGFLLTICLVARNGEGNAVLQTLLGVLGTGWVAVINFYYGSSIGSKEKNALLGEANISPK